MLEKSKCKAMSILFLKSMLFLCNLDHITNKRLLKKSTIPIRHFAKFSKLCQSSVKSRIYINKHIITIVKNKYECTIIQMKKPLHYFIKTFNMWPLNRICYHFQIQNEDKKFNMTHDDIKQISLTVENSFNSFFIQLFLFSRHDYLC